jgi:hypothetical protein
VVPIAILLTQVKLAFKKLRFFGTQTRAALPPE